MQADWSRADFVARPATAPVDAMPGTTDKIAAMRLRVELGVEPFHPDDPHVRPDKYQHGYDNTDRRYALPMIFELPGERLFPLG